MSTTSRATQLCFRRPLAYGKSVFEPTRSATPRGARRSLSTSGHDRQRAIAPFRPLYLDFLLPPRPQKLPLHSPLSKALNPPERQSRRPISTSRAHHATTTVSSNPRLDDDGQPMQIDISPRASHRLAEIMSQDANPTLLLRVTVESGGCHGFQYLMSLTTSDKVNEEEDTVFEATDGTGAKVVLDEPSLELLKGSTVDYSMELIGSQFRVVGIKGAKSSCGCGSSFDIQT